MFINMVDVADGALVNAIAVMGRRIGAVLMGPRGQTADDLDIARWFETQRLTGKAPDLPDLSPALSEKVAAILDGDEVQAALQELLAARLTDAPEMDAARAREVMRLTLDVGAPDARPSAEAVADYCDEQICNLVGRLGVYDPPALAQIRAEAFATRMIAILNAIERHAAALTTRPGHRTEAGFLSSYRRHVTDQHGKLEPPDFERRRRVPIKDIYVPTMIIEALSPERTVASRSADQSSLDVYALAERLDRSVLLGDPGGGKTTAATVLMHHFASDTEGRIPFLVTLRDYAAKDPPERSVVSHIEHTLETFYQSPSPPGLVDLLLLTGRAVVIFDGLDELLDTARRADVTARVERFCAEYPLAAILVTSRIIGYDQARLDDRQFNCYRLGGFGDEQVAEYASKWFALDADARPGDAKAFLAESASVPDLRPNPLMLALLCILYRGEGSLPRNRAEVYEQCATMLYRRWDARRRIHQDLQAGHLIEPTLRHLAWRLFTRDDAKSAVTERELVADTTEFLHGRGFESADHAREAAAEFVRFCRGRMWVFSDAGTTAWGERLYAFTHRTFLEYFAAAHLAFDSDTPEQLADILAVRIARKDWWVVAELAVQIKDRTSNRGAQRIYANLLDSRDWRSANEEASVLEFLSGCLRSVDPSPQRVHDITRRVIEGTIAANVSGTTSSLTGAADRIIADTRSWLDAMRLLIISCGAYRGIVADEIATTVADNTKSGDRVTTVSSLRIAAFLFDVDSVDYGFWRSRMDDILRIHAAKAALAVEDDLCVRNVALWQGIISVRKALELPGGLSALFYTPGSLFSTFGGLPYLATLYQFILAGCPASASSAVVADLKAVGEYLRGHPELPWVRGQISPGMYNAHDAPAVPAAESAQFGPIGCLGGAAIVCILTEDRRTDVLDWDPRQFGPLSSLLPYLKRRFGVGPDTDAELPDLAVPEEFRQTFRNWAEWRIGFRDSER